jgi:hypothetical protein
VSEVAYLAKDPVDAAREGADLAREVPLHNLLLQGISKHFGA